MTDEEIITKAFNDNAHKYEDWKDCCVAMMREVLVLSREIENKLDGNYNVVGVNPNAKCGENVALLQILRDWEKLGYEYVDYKHANTGEGLLILKKQ